MSEQTRGKFPDSVLEDRSVRKTHLSYTQNVVDQRSDRRSYHVAVN